tara:strand:+ start:831 stop:1493 length:663 start_codon:yes stop_codon:yes gene_type:complete
MKFTATQVDTDNGPEYVYTFNSPPKGNFNNDFFTMLNSFKDVAGCNGKNVYPSQKNDWHYYSSDPIKAWHVAVKVNTHNAVRVWAESNGFDVLWCGSTTTPNEPTFDDIYEGFSKDYQSQKSEKSSPNGDPKNSTAGPGTASAFNDFQAIEMTPEIEFAEALFGNGSVPKEIKLQIANAAYKAAAKCYHPDVCKLSDAHIVMVNLNKAHKVLKDSLKSQQ